MWIYTLEYSEEQKAFHYNNGRHPENTNGFVTIATGCNDFILRKFMEYLDEHFIFEYEFTLSEVQAEWVKFLDSIKQL